MSASEQRELDEIRAEFQRAEYDLDLDEVKDGWGAAYHHRDSMIGTRQPFFGKTELDAARQALAAFHAEQEQQVDEIRKEIEASGRKMSLSQVGEPKGWRAVLVPANAEGRTVAAVRGFGKTKLAAARAARDSLNKL